MKIILKSVKIWVEKQKLYEVKVKSFLSLYMFTQTPTIVLTIEPSF